MGQSISQDEYEKLFGSREILEAALKQAYEIRKFEIELYWKRATYFWSFIGATFVAYASFYNGTSLAISADKKLILILIACIGLVFSIAWHCVNKGSKFWQENWENHVELLEDKVFGPLYKTYSERPASSKLIDIVADFFVAPKSFSVSKINQLVSTYIALIWILILLYSISPFCFISDSSCHFNWDQAILIGLSIVTCITFWIFGKSHQEDHNPQVFLRDIKISSEVEQVSSE